MGTQGSTLAVVAVGKKGVIAKTAGGAVGGVGGGDGTGLVFDGGADGDVAAVSGN